MHYEKCSDKLERMWENSEFWSASVDCNTLVTYVVDKMAHDRAASDLGDESSGREQDRQKASMNNNDRTTTTEQNFQLITSETRALYFRKVDSGVIDSAHACIPLTLTTGFDPHQGSLTCFLSCGGKTCAQYSGTHSSDEARPESR